MSLMALETDDHPCRRARMRTPQDRRSGSARHEEFGNQSEELESTRAEILQEKKFGKLLRIAFVGGSEHSCETLEINVLWANLMVAWEAEMARSCNVVSGFSRAI